MLNLETLLMLIAGAVAAALVSMTTVILAAFVVAHIWGV